MFRLNGATKADRNGVFAMNKTISRPLVALIFTACIAGCQPATDGNLGAGAGAGAGVGVSADNGAGNDTTSTAAATDTSAVVVTVGGEPITEDDVNAAIERTLGGFGAMQLDAQGRQKIIESLVMSKTMAIAQRQSTSPQELLEIERTVAAYRDELLTKAYLKDHIDPAPVSQKMVQDYYDKYPERFGGKTVRHYEIVKVTVKQQSKLKNQLVEALGKFKTTMDWKKSVAKLNQNSAAKQFEYAKGAASSQMLEQQFAQVVNGLEANEVSPVYFFEGYPSIMRVTKLVKTPPKPLSQVSDQIRKTLLPVQLKQAIKQASHDLSATIAVEYQSDDRVTND